MPDEPTTDDLLARARGGDLDAFGQIVVRHDRAIRGWLAVRCPPGVDADDVTQATFVEAFRRMHEFAAGTAFKAWLFTIARYQLLGETTRRRRLADYHSRYVPHALAEELARRAAADADTDDTDLKLRLLRECLADLPAADRRLLRGRYADGVPLADVADRLRRSVGAVKKHLFVLRRRLHECVDRKRTAGGGVS